MSLETFSATCPLASNARALDAASLNSIETTPVRCPACGRIHRFNPKSGSLIDDPRLAGWLRPRS
jgi:hypothetical protein